MVDSRLLPFAVGSGESSSFDALTGVYDRKQYDNDLPIVVAGCISSSRPISLAIIDIDHFKEFNDAYGHDIGDRVLQEAAHAMKASCEGKGRCYRWGGDEFVIVLPNYTSAEATTLAERIRSAALKVRVEGCPDSFTVSAGVAEHRGQAPDPDQLFKDADSALREVKKSGKDRVGIAPHNAASEGSGIPPKSSDLQSRIDSAHLSVRLTQGISSWYVIHVKNHSDEDITVKSLGLATPDGVELMSPAESEGQAAWKIAPRSVGVIGFRPDRDPAVQLETICLEKIREHYILGRRQFSLTITVVLFCEICGKSKEFRKPIAVSLDVNNHQLTQLA